MKLLHQLMYTWLLCFEFSPRKLCEWWKWQTMICSCSHLNWRWTNDFASLMKLLVLLLFPGRSWRFYLSTAQTVKSLWLDSELWHCCSDQVHLCCIYIYIFYFTNFKLIVLINSINSILFHLKIINFINLKIKIFFAI